MHHDHRTFTEAQQLTEIAQRIGEEGACAVLHCNLSDENRRRVENAASWYLCSIADGLDDEDGFAEMVDEYINPARDATWALDSDFLRDERVSWEMAA